MLSTTDAETKKKQICSPHRVFSLLFTHIGLALMLIAYAVIGAAVFQAIEGKFEIQERIHLAETRHLVFRSIWNLTVASDAEEDVNYTSWMEQVEEIFKEYDHVHRRAVIHGVDDELPLKWTFSGSLFFACTVFTTIGYGNIAPESVGGRVFCMCYAFVGIPLLMLVIVDLGTLLARGTKYLYFKLVRRCMKKASGRVSCCDNKKEQNPVNGKKFTKKEPGEGIENPVPVTEGSKAGDNDSNVDGGGGDAIVMEGRDVDEEEAKKEEEEEFDIPILAVICFGFFYVLMLALMISLWEDWTYFECFYFSFITLSTIGLGDMVPEHQKYTIASSFFILLGMTVMTMCITLSQNKIQHSLHWMGWQIGVQPKPEYIEDSGDENENKSATAVAV